MEIPGCLVASFYRVRWELCSYSWGFYLLPLLYTLYTMYIMMQCMLRMLCMLSTLSMPGA